MTTLQQITTSLEVSKQLKEAGFKQESLFYWIGRTVERSVLNNNNVCYELYQKGEFVGQITDYFSAPTASELMEMLPQKITVEGNHYCGDNICNQFYLDFNRDVEIGNIKRTGFIYFYTNGEENLKFDYDEDNWAENEADARALLWLYLKSNNLLKEK